MTRIGVFDSGVGGKSVAEAISKAMPSHHIIFRDDSKNMPYGSKPLEQIYQACKPVIASLVDDGCQIVVVACNTVTTNLIDRLRTDFAVPLIGIEPMVKPAAMATRSKVIAVCATPRTLGSRRYQELKERYASGVVVIEPDCSEWSTMIENGQINVDKVRQSLEAALGQGADQIVLGCTHYHWIEELVKQVAKNKAAVLQPEASVVAQLKTVLAQLT